MQQTCPRFCVGCCAEVLCAGVVQMSCAGLVRVSCAEPCFGKNTPYPGLALRVDMRGVAWAFVQHSSWCYADWCCAECLRTVGFVNVIFGVVQCCAMLCDVVLVLCGVVGVESGLGLSYSGVICLWLL